MQYEVQVRARPSGDRRGGETSHAGQTMRPLPCVALGPIAVVELSEVVGRRPRLWRSLLCPECADWAKTWLRATPVPGPGEENVPDPPLRQVMR